MTGTHSGPGVRSFVPDMEARRHLLDNATGWQDLTPEAGQMWTAPYGPPEEWDLVIEDREIDGPHGTIPIRVYSPTTKDSNQRPSLVWCHGGGWAFGDLDMAEAHEVSKGIAGRANAVVISVGYSLCPLPQVFRSESTTTTTDVPAVRFPIPHTEVMAAYSWVKEFSSELGIDKDRIAIGGASAGANLAAGAALNLRDDGEAPSQVLLSYPIVHPELPQPSAELAEAIASTPRLLRFPPEVLTPLVTSYLGE